jgi:MHS family proline/betaine transporter-like MFS transporter
MQFMAAAMLVTACLPTSASVGALGGVLLLLLRCVMAFSVGGEYNGVIAYLFEGAKPERRGIVTAMASATSEIGGLLAVGVAAFVTMTVDAETLEDWGWRVPFFVGALLAGGVWFARRAMAESPEFERLRESRRTVSNPFAHALLQHRAGIARAFAISALGSITYYVGITWVPTFLATTAHAGDRAALYVSTIAAVAVVLVTPVVGWAADAFGRRAVLLVLAICGIALPAAMFSLMKTSSLAAMVGAAVVLALLAGGVSAVGAVASAEQFPGASRLSGLALGNTSATVLFGGFAPLVAQIVVEATGWASSPGLLIAATALCVLPVFWRIRETPPDRGA